jgi:hypothetical protein
MAAMQAPIIAAAHHSRLPTPPPDPIKGHPHSAEASHPLHLASSPPHLSPCRSCLEPKPHRRCTTSSLHPSSGERSPGRSMSLPSHCHPRGKPPRPGVAVRPSSGEPLPSVTVESTVEPSTGHPMWSTDPWTESTTFSHWKIIPKHENSCHFTKKPLYLFKINPQSTDFQEAPWIFENNSRYSPSHFKKLQIGPYNFFTPYLCNRNSKSSDSYTKILRITSYFILCIHLIYVCCTY